MNQKQELLKSAGEAILHSVDMLNKYKHLNKDKQEYVTQIIANILWVARKRINYLIELEEKTKM